MATLSIPPAIEEAINRQIQVREQEERGEPVIPVEDSPDVLRERILEGLTVAAAFADRLADPEYAQAVRDKLTRSNVRGSEVKGVRSLTDVQQLLESVTDWTIVDSNHDSKQIQCIQGSLPAAYLNRAYAAYASVREISQRYGQPGLSTIQAKQGNQKDDEFYLCTVLRYPTDVLTVQLKQSQNGTGCEYLHQWFAGPELTSLIRVDDGDTMVRCGVVIPYVNDPKRYAPRKNSGYAFAG